jgi:hypothetical protein
MPEYPRGQILLKENQGKYYYHDTTSRILIDSNYTILYSTLYRLLFSTIVVCSGMVCCNNNTLQLAVQLVTKMNNTKVNSLQYFQSQWYQLTFDTCNGCIFTPRRCKNVKIIKNQPSSGRFCCFVNNMTKSYIKIN